ncbi:hypothetical protein GCM10023186_22950 [Hymenobacter koreensis]|uniref:DUF4251 domain-containing protein n=1 Tax=Hymenobacter koreensis TaxID=1084523 RepID=A0ABP8J035_9BACT
MPLLIGCSQVREANESLQTVSAATRAVNQAEASLTRTEQLRQTRAASGDTISLPYQELRNYLPHKLAGFVRDGAPQGESVSLGGVNYSTCEQYYRKGKQRLKVQLVDYNGASALYAGATAMMAAGFTQEDDEQLMRGCDLGIPNVLGYETLQKKEGRASVALGVGDRFFLSVELDQQQTTHTVRNVAKAIDLQTLARL